MFVRYSITSFLAIHVGYVPEKSQTLNNKTDILGPTKNCSFPSLSAVFASANNEWRLSNC
jgi:hypothetical protein